MSTTNTDVTHEHDDISIENSEDGNDDDKVNDDEVIEDSNEEVIDSRSEENSYHCSICHNVMYRPVTLICQHSYCYPCLETYYNGDKIIPDYHFNLAFYTAKKQDKCPLCNIPYTLPPMENTLFAELLEKKYPEQYEQQRIYITTTKNEEAIKMHTENRIRKEVWNLISTDFNTRSPPVNSLPMTNTLVEPYPYRIRVEEKSYWSHFKETLFTYSPIYLMGFVVFTGAAVVIHKLPK
jgi:hypothetical protein